MTLQITSVDNQAKGQFNAGQILENKPIGFPQDGGNIRPYSSLFYWAHAWTPGAKSLIGEHPHQGFEIMSFVLKGSIEHYDSKLKGWKKLEAGDAQIIRSGNGITHAELVNDTSEFFQIWLDPDLAKTLQKDASYDDYKSDEFPVIESQAGIQEKIYKGDGAPMEMDTPGVLIKQLTIQSGDYTYELNKNATYSAYLISGSMMVNGQELKVKDFVIIKDMDTVEISAKDESVWFIIESPNKLDYLTYQERVQQQNWN